MKLLLSVRRQCLLWLLLVLASVLQQTDGASSSPGYLIVTAKPNKVLYARLLSSNQQAVGTPMVAHELISGGANSSLKKVEGAAVDNLRGILYVADHHTQCVWAMRIYEDANRPGHLAHDEPIAVLTGIKSRWMAVDSVGTLFTTDSDQAKIWSLPVFSILQSLDIQSNTDDGLLDGVSAIDAGAAEPTETDQAQNSPKLLYSIFYSSSVQTPHGIAADGLYLYWANGQTGETNGVVVRGLQDRGSQSDEDQHESVLRLSTEGSAAMGLCLTGSRIFVTQGNKVMSMESTGGTPVEVTNRLSEGKGIVFDGDGTVFVADKGANKVYSFSGGAPHMSGRRLNLALEMNQPVGLAVFAPTSQHSTGNPADSGAAPAAVASYLAAVCTMLALVGIS